MYIYIYTYVYIGSSQVLELHTMGWGDGVGWERSCELAEAVDATHTRGGVGGGWGGMLTFM